jgi:hypothetical protein
LNPKSPFLSFFSTKMTREELSSKEASGALISQRQILRAGVPNLVMQEGFLEHLFTRWPCPDSLCGGVGRHEKGDASTPGGDCAVGQHSWECSQ